MAHKQDVIEVESAIHAIGSLTESLVCFARLKPNLMRLKMADINTLADELLDLHAMLRTREAAE